MRQRTFGAAVLAALGVLPVTAHAASTVTLVAPMNYAVQGDGVALMRVRVTNTGGTNVDRVTFNFNAGSVYDFSAINGVNQPAGWTTTALSANQVQYTASAVAQIPLGQSRDFDLQLIGNGGVVLPAAASDVTDSFSAIQVRHVSGPGDTPASPTWTRHALSLTLIATPSSVRAGSTVTLRYLIENRSSNAKNTIGSNPAAPVTLPAGAVTGGTGPTPAQLNLATNERGEMVYSATVAAGAPPSFRFQANVQNANSSSPLVQSNVVSVGQLTATLAILETATATGQNVTVEMAVKNNGPDPAYPQYALGNVVPSRDPATRSVIADPLPLGTATATKVSGPSPGSIASLAVGETGYFRWTYNVTGVTGATLSFQGGAIATGIESPLVTSNQISLAGISSRVSPSSVARTGVPQPLTITVANGSQFNITDNFTFTFATGFTLQSAGPVAGYTASLPAANQARFVRTGAGIPAGSNVSFPMTLAANGVPDPPGGSQAGDEVYPIGIQLDPVFAGYFTTVPITVTSRVIVASATPATSVADGTSTVQIRATVTRSLNGSALPGETVNFSTTAGTFACSVPPCDVAVTDANGIATVTLTAPASPTNVIAAVTATIGVAQSTVNVTFTGFAGANLLYVGGSIYPREVAPGSVVTFSIDVVNTGTAPATIPSAPNTTYLELKNGNPAQDYRAYLGGTQVIAPGATATLVFAPTALDPAFAFGTWYPTFTYNPTRTIDDPVIVGATPTWASVVGFSAEPYGDGVRLSWATDLEFANQGFRVLRATDGGEPEYLDAWIPSSGASFSDYEWIDAPVAGGVHEYWIEDVADDGVATRHGPVAIALGGAALPEASAGPGLVSGSGFEPDPSVWIDPDDLGDVRVLEWDETGITWEIAPPPHDVASVEAPDGTRQLLTIAGWDSTDEPGRPVLPSRSLLVPVPPGATGKLVLREVADETLPGLAPVIASGIASTDAFATPDGRAAPGAAGAITDETWPASPATLHDRGRMGNRRVVSLVVTPMRWDPVERDVRRASRIVARVDFVAAAPEPIAPRTAAEETQRRIVRGPSLEVHVAREGLVRVPLSAIAAAGVDPSTAAVYRRGEAVPMRVDGDALLFVAPAFESPWTRTQAFWIAAAGEPSPVIAAASGAPAVGAAASDARRTLAFESDSFFAPLTAQGIGADRWYWAQVPAAGGAQTASVDLSVPAAGASATLTVTLQGLLDDGLPSAEHRIRVRLSGADLGTVSFGGYDRRAFTFAIPDGTLAAGTNALAVENVSALPSRVALDSAELSFVAPATAGADDLTVTALADGVLTASGFVTAPAWAVDESDPSAPRLLALATEADRASVAANAGAKVRFVSAPSPATWSARAPGSVLDLAGADFLVIAGDGLIDAAHEWAAWRASQGLRAVAIEASAIEDETGFGDRDPAALHRFLELASRTWAEPAPRYLLLLGDSTYDPRDNLGGGVPSGLLLSDRVGTHALDAPSDSLTAALGSLDRLPDLAVGRVPARTPAEALAALAKVVAYESAPRDGWHAREVFFADDDLPEFAATAADAKRYLPMGATPDGIDAAQLGDATARMRLLDSFDDGAALASYFGHGAVQTWGGELYLGNSDAASLANARLPVVAAVDCLNAYFDHPSAESLGEALVRAPSGAIAVWTSSAITRDAGHRELSRAFHRAFWREPETRLGDVVNRAYAHVAGRSDADELIGSFLLLGDPALRLNVNRPPVAVARLVDVDGLTARATGSASWDADGDAIAWRWEVVTAPAGATATLAADGAGVTLTGSRPGLYRLRLRAADASVASPGDDLLVELQPGLESPAAGGCAVGRGSATLPPLGLALAALLLARRRRP